MDVFFDAPAGANAGGLPAASVVNHAVKALMVALAVVFLVCLIQMARALDELRGRRRMEPPPLRPMLDPRSWWGRDV